VGAAFTHCAIRSGGTAKITFRPHSVLASGEIRRYLAGLRHLKKTAGDEKT
jgi:hypothetical protein